MRLNTIALAAILSAGLATPLAAHHGWSTYDSSTTIVIEAPILEASYENPHGAVVLEDEEGTRWQVVLAPPARMNNRGLAREALVEGQTVTVEGHPSTVHDGEMRAERITVDGTTTELR